MWVPSGIDFPKCRREIAAPLGDFSDRWCGREDVEPDALRSGGLAFLGLLMLVFHFALVMHIFCPLSLGLLFVVLSGVSGVFVWAVFWFQQIKLLTML